MPSMRNPQTTFFVSCHHEDMHLDYGTLVITLHSLICVYQCSI